jgi:lipoprotein-anchoring transpeptidase ErfK/SrfK
MRLAARLGIAAVALLLAGCTPTPTMYPGVAAPSASAGPPATLAVSPAKDTKSLPISTEIGTKVTNGKVQSVVLADASGVALPGRLREDLSSWVPDNPLKFSTAYTATVTVLGEDGKTVTESTAFTTMSKPSKRNGVGLYLFADKEYGVAMPVVVEFSNPVPADARAGVQSRLFVTTDPPQPGVWHWSSPKQVMYRAKDYWQPGTKIVARIALEGHPMGDGRYGDSDLRGTGNISKDKLELIVDNATKQMTVLKNGDVIRTVPVSLGKASTPSSSGTLAIMDKKVKTIFDTTNDVGIDHYIKEIEYAQRLTWSGQYIHSAPWSTQYQGNTNVSHGCVNVSPENAKWLFDLTRIGDPVVIKGTEEKVASGDGFTAYSWSWDEWSQSQP